MKLKNNNIRKGGYPEVNWSPLLKSYIDFCNYKTIIEIGVQYGETTKDFCEVARKIGGKVYGYDFFAPIRYYGPKYPITPQQEEIERLIGEHYFLDGTCKLTKVDTHSDEFSDILKSDTDGCIDFAFIDACHSYDGVKNDFEKVFPLLSPEGTIVFHDTFSHAGPRKFMLELYKDNDGTFDLVNLPFGGGPGCEEYSRIGLAFLVKRSYLTSEGGVINNGHDDHNPINLRSLYNEEVEWYSDQLKDNK